jgi:hypothetical protein
VSAVRGRPFQPGNKLGKGRPRGSRNKVNAKAKELFIEYSEPVAKKCLAMALQGDLRAIQMSLDRAVPVRRDHRLEIGPLPMTTAADVDRASEIVTQKVARGQISVEHGTAFAELLERRRKAIETQDLARRMSAIEQMQSGEARV